MRRLIRIFGPEIETDQGLWSVKYHDRELSEFDTLWNDWDDPQIMYRFCVNNINEICAAFNRPIDAKEASNLLMDEAEELSEHLYNLATAENGMGLQAVFKALHNLDHGLYVLQLTKGSVKGLSRIFTSPKLRIYAVRIDKNTFVVTGGAIKLTHLMEEHPTTLRQLKELKKIRDWLNEEGIQCSVDLNQLL